MRNLGRIFAGGAALAILAAGVAQAQTIEKLDWIGHNAEGLQLREMGRYAIGYDQDWIIPPAATHVVKNADGTTTETLDLPPSPHQTQPRPYTHYTYAWPGIYFDARFEGDKFFFVTNDSENILSLLVDGKVIGQLEKPGKAQYAVQGLNWGIHEVRLEKLTESQSGTGRFDGFYISQPQSHGLPPGEKLEIALEPAHLARQIEFIGDSYTVGYGNTAGKRTCTKDEIWATTDTSQAFGPLTAKHYNADYQINAFSGRGMVRNYGGFIGDPLPALYPYTLYDGKTEYSRLSWQPQIIVIGLGTNDFTTPLHDGEKWKTRDELHADYEATYVKFVQDLRAQNPDAYFILMATDQVDGEIQSEAKKALAAIQATGETRITFLPMNGLNFGGCDYHPDTDDDRKISGSLITWIDAHPGIWQGK
jgi:lysophospholipase L1-like esterase